MTMNVRFKRGTIALAGALAFSLVLPLSSAASTRVIGAPMAGECSRVALDGEYSPEALRICNVALETEALGRSDAAKTHVNRAVIHLRRKDLVKSQYDLRLAEQLMPTLPEVFINRAAVLIYQQRFDEALREINHGISLDPSEPEKAYYNRAVVRERLADFPGAYSDYRRALALAPDWEAPKKMIARFQVD